MMTYKQLLDLVLKTEGYHLDKPVVISMEFDEYTVESVNIQFVKDDKGNPTQKIVLAV